MSLVSNLWCRILWATARPGMSDVEIAHAISKWLYGTPLKELPCSRGAIGGFIGRYTTLQRPPSTTDGWKSAAQSAMVIAHEKGVIYWPLEAR